MVAILMTSLLGPDAELRWANWFKLFHMTQSLFWYRSPKSSQNLHGMPIRHRLVSAYLKQVKTVSKTAIHIEKQLNYLAENWCIFSAI